MPAFQLSYFVTVKNSVFVREPFYISNLVFILYWWRNVHADTEQINVNLTITVVIVVCSDNTSERALNSSKLVSADFRRVYALYPCSFSCAPCHFLLCRSPVSGQLCLQCGQHSQCLMGVAIPTQVPCPQALHIISVYVSCGIIKYSCVGISHAAVFSLVIIWSGQRDSNPRHSVSKTDASRFRYQTRLHPVKSMEVDSPLVQYPIRSILVPEHC